MKKLILLPAIFLILSCNGNSDEPSNGANNVKGLGEVPLNFSIAKYNEDLLNNLYFPEMNTVLEGLQNIKKKTENCDTFETTKTLKSDWKKLALSYQKAWPLDSATIDRDLNVSRLKKTEFLDGIYSISPCRVQSNVAKGADFSRTLRDDPALNTLEYLIFSELTSTNSCRTNQDGGVDVDEWLESDLINKTKSVCKAIRKLSDHTFNELNSIVSENKRLYNEGDSDLIFSTGNTQKVYDTLAIFVDQILKDQKLGFPLGMSSQCPWRDSSCPNAVEHKYSGITFEALAKNLEGLIIIFNQNPKLTEKPLQRGLYHFLYINDHQALADSIYSNLVRAHKQTTSLVGEDLETLAQEINSPDGKEKCRRSSYEEPIVPVCALFNTVKKISDSVKVDLRLALALSKTKQTEGDTD